MQLILPQGRWYDEKPVTLDLPDIWEVEVAESKGDEKRGLSYEELKARICAPIGCAPVQELAKGKKKVCIIFDDITRGTPTKEIVHILLEEVLAAGVPKNKIIFVCALGLHAPENRMDFVKKLGEDIVEEYPVFNHNAFGNLKYVGTTTRGTYVEFNAEVMSCDLKLGVGAMTPHPFNAFGGGCKLMLPGVASFRTIEENHRHFMGQVIAQHLQFAGRMGDMSNYETREDCFEASRMGGLDFKVDCILNTRDEIVACFAGDPVEEYYAGVSTAQELYSAQLKGNADLVITNANSKLNEAITAKSLAETFVKDGGDIVVVNHCPTGQVTHYIAGPWGLDTRVEMFDLPERLPRVRKIILFTPYKDYTSGMYFGVPEQLVWCKTWDEVLQELGYSDKKIKVSVIRDGTIQYFPQMIAAE